MMNKIYQYTCKTTFSLIKCGSIWQQTIYLFIPPTRDQAVNVPTWCLMETSAEEYEGLVVEPGLPCSPFPTWDSFVSKRPQSRHSTKQGDGSSCHLYLHKVELSVDLLSLRHVYFLTKTTIFSQFLLFYLSLTTTTSSPPFPAPKGCAKVSIPNLLYVPNRTIYARLQPNKGYLK